MRRRGGGGIDSIDLTRECFKVNITMKRLIRRDNVILLAFDSSLQDNY